MLTLSTSGACSAQRIDLTENCRVLSAMAQASGTVSSVAARVSTPWSITTCRTGPDHAGEEMAVTVAHIVDVKLTAVTGWRDKYIFEGRR